MNKDITARLRISALDRTGQVFKSIAGKMDHISQRAERMNMVQTRVAMTAQAMYLTMARVAAPAAAAYAAARTVKAYAEIERTLGRIGLTAGATEERTAAAFGSMKSMAQRYALPLDQVVEGLNTLVASGKDLDGALAFLPSVLAAAQASGTATQDIANTAIKAAGALKIEASGLQEMFDRMVYSGNLGQFELNEMARYIPDLANSFASLGYQGQEGLNVLLAALQTLREDTGSAESAATQAQNVFGKMFSNDTAKKFSQFGIDLRTEMEKAAQSGEHALKAFVRLTKEALDGDLSKLPQLFTDQEFRLGMQSLVTSTKEFDQLLASISSRDVAGTVGRQLKRVTADTESSIQRMSTSWDNFVTNIGKGISPFAVPVLDGVSERLEYGDAVQSGVKRYELEAGGSKDELMRALQDRYGSLPENEAIPKLLRSVMLDRDIGNAVAQYGRGETSSPFELVSLREEGLARAKDMERLRPQLDAAYASYRTGGRDAMPDFPGGGTGMMPMPGTKPANGGRNFPSIAEQMKSYGEGRVIGEGMRDFEGGQREFISARMDALTAHRDELALGMREAGQEGGKAFGDEATGKIQSDAAVAGSAFGDAAASKINQATNTFVRAINAAKEGGGSAQRNGVNADTGRSMPESAGKPWGGW